MVPCASTAPTAPISPVQAGEKGFSATAGRGPHHPSARRPALDGIRALAVTAVVIYHFGGGAGSWLPGGFLGVDVFFVLSGYLITGLLLASPAADAGVLLHRAAGAPIRAVR
jgi:peptidoglycan/LPS O-acetylase OafA/YrhL